MEQTKQKNGLARTIIYWVLVVLCFAVGILFLQMLPLVNGGSTAFPANLMKWIAAGKKSGLVQSISSSFGYAGILGGIVLVCLYFVLKKVNYQVTGKSRTMNLAFTGMMAALVLLGYLFTIRLPISDKAQIGFGNVFCIFSGLMLGPIYGGLAAGLGSFLYDITSGWADTCLLTFVTKFVMAFVCGTIAWGIHGKLLTNEVQKKQIVRTVLAAVIGSLCYSILYLTHSYISGILVGNTVKALDTIVHVKLAVTLFNGIVADVVAVPLFYAIRAALKRSHLAFGA
ncbi:MAG: ECF transporter S component [Oscillospiraceae bacterium]|jgi:uncharacterized membrane protein|nr:ECF transporter S component [Oscillospiraceae bacterium]